MSVRLLKKTYDLLVDKVESINEEIRLNSIKIQKAAEFGDLKENAEYKTAREHAEFLFDKLRRFEKYLHCQIIDGKDIESDRIVYGTSVKAVNTKSGDILKYNIVGPVELELDIMDDIVTYGSPLAKQIMGKKEGDEVELELPNRVDTIKILEIEPIL